MPEKPKPCPFCGDEPGVSINQRQVVCSNPRCGCEDAFEFEKWNTRPIESRLETELLSLRKASHSVSQCCPESERLAKRVEELEKQLASYTTEDPPKPALSKGYFLLCTRHGYADGELLWWRPNGCGYTTILDQAGVYDEEEALDIVRGTDDLAIPTERAIEYSHWHKPESGYWFVGCCDDKGIRQIGHRTKKNMLAAAAESLTARGAGR